MKEKQVKKDHYTFGKYMGKPRWNSVWHQLDEVMSVEPERVLEVGVGSGLFKAVAKNFGLDVKTLDIAEDLNPDYLASATNMPFEDCAFDTICCFQMLEHLPYEMTLEALEEFNRVAEKNIIISLPDAKPVYPVSMQIPKIGKKQYLVPRPQLKPTVHKFDGQHYWELNKQDYQMGGGSDGFFKSA